MWEQRELLSQENYVIDSKRARDDDGGGAEAGTSCVLLMRLEVGDSIDLPKRDSS